jgi:hypothetical protein
VWRSKITTARPHRHRRPKQCAAMVVTGFTPAGALSLAVGCGGSTSSQDPSAQLFKFAACMRSHGLPNFPDPQKAAQGAKHSVSLGIPDSIASLPMYHTAFRTCEHFAPSGFFPSAQAQH